MFSYFNLRRPSEFSKVNASDGSGSASASGSGHATPVFGTVVPSAASPLTVQQPPGSRPLSFNEAKLNSRPSSVQFDPQNFARPNGGGNQFDLTTQITRSAVNGQFPFQQTASSDFNDGPAASNGENSSDGGLNGIRSVLFQNINVKGKILF